MLNLNKTNKIRFTFLGLIVLFLVVIMASVQKKEQVQAVNFNFKYFCNIDNSGIYKCQITIPILKQLKTPAIVKDLKTYLVLDENLKYYVSGLKIAVNDYKIFNPSQDELNCDIYPYSCLLSIPNQAINRRNTRILVNNDLFELNKNNKTYLGIYFDVSDGN